MTDLRIDRVLEWEIDKELEVSLNVLLSSCFSDYPSSFSFYRQRPSFRFIIHEGNDLIGQCGIHYRVIKIGDEYFNIFGISDFCMLPKSQGKGYARRVLNEMIHYSEQCNVDFLVTFSGENDFYKKMDFVVQDNYFKWLMIAQSKSLGIVNRRLHDCVFVYSISGAKWETGDVDLLGSIF